MCPLKIGFQNYGSIQNTSAMPNDAKALINEAKERNSTFLSLANCDLLEIPAELIELTSLEVLELVNNQISDISLLSSLTRLTALYLRINNITDITPLRPLVNLSDLDLATNKISDIGPLQPLTKLHTLYLYNNQIQDLTPLQSLSNLKELYLKNNQVKDLTPLNSLSNVGMISLANNQVFDIESILPLIKKGVDIKLDQNPLITPPQEVVSQGNEAIVRYFEETKKQGEKFVYEAKIVIVGAGESGKTTLIKKLLDPGHPVPNPDDKRTEGIRITSLPFNTMMNGIKKRPHSPRMGFWRTGTVSYDAPAFFDTRHVVHPAER
jgi:hypothetical protein